MIDRYANMVMLGILAKISSLASKQAIEKAIRETVSEKTVEINIEPLE
jgi:Pyruvate/2-oxoacid:ferredoxin oxidoreductase gamma subunit